MTITNNGLAPRYYTNSTDEQIPPISAMELTGLHLPESMGYYIATQLPKNSILSELMVTANEITVSSDQVYWREQGDNLTSDAVKANYEVASRQFTPNPTAFDTDDLNIDTKAPVNCEFIGIEAGMKFTVFDSTGEMNFGMVESVASDNRSFVGKAIGEGVSAFTIGADVEIFFTGLNLNDCECPPAIQIKDWSPTYEAQLEKDGVKVEYCKETLARQGAKFDYIPTPEGYVSVDKRIDDAIKALQARVENKHLLSGRASAAQAAAAGRNRLGTWGLLPTLEARAMKVEGLIDDDDELRQLVKELKKKEVYEAEMWCSDDQYDALQLLYPSTSQFSFFENHEGDLKYFEYAGVKINGVKLYFKSLSALNKASEYAAKRYNFFIKPKGNLSVYINGETKNVGYLTRVYFDDKMGSVYKNLREEVVGTTKDYCGVKEVNFYDKSALVAVMPRKWVIGVNP